MALLGKGPCTLAGWEPDEACLKLPADTTPEQRQFWQRVAAEILYNRTGQRFGDGCTHAVRPCRKSCTDQYRWLWQGQTLGSGYRMTGGFIPYMAGGEMYNATVCGCETDCHCGSELCQIELPGPILDITKVDINGTEINKALYFSYDARFLVLRPEVADVHPELGITCWPMCQDLSRPPEQPNTFTVYYSVGIAVPFMAAAAMSEIMNHLASQCNGCGCGADARQALQRLSRQGVELEFADAQQVFTDGRIGLPLADLFVQTYNPGGLPRQMRVLSPDAPKRPKIYLGY